MLVVLGCASAASAQQITSSLEAFKAFANTDSTVTVTDRNGRQYRGIVADASQALLSLKTGDTIHQFAAADISSVRVRKEDPLTNGALIGAALCGGATSLLFLDNECRDDPSCYQAVAVYGGLGAVAGLGIDRLIHGDLLVYTAAASGAERVFRLEPIVARGRNGVRLTIGF
jgi:hypothetical protein